MRTPPPALLLTVPVALLSAMGGCAAASLASRTDPALVRLVERLVEADRTASIISAGIVAAAAILASLVIPTVTLLALLRHQSRPLGNQPPIQLGIRRADRRLRAGRPPQIGPPHGQPRSIGPADTDPIQRHEAQG